MSITVQLDPVWNGGDGSSRRLQFSAIQNFEDVAAFFRQASSAEEGGDLVDVFLGIVLVSKGIIGLEFGGLGYVELRGAKVRES